MRVSIIAAVAENGVIGKDNDLAWHLPDDMAFFKETTKGRTVVMGRKNYESIPHKFRPLPKRVNMIITRNTDYEAPGCEVFNDIGAALAKAAANGEQHCFIIGGGEIYKLSLLENLVDDLYITEVHHKVEGDTYFPKIDDGKWDGHVLSRHPADERHNYSFTIKHYQKIASNQ
ncbi:MAG: dihydrofolate reductase [Flavobacteriales bacterium]|nr:dihydrofolate reductase [Flavobacteriales bacterium]